MWGGGGGSSSNGVGVEYECNFSKCDNYKVRCSKVCLTKSGGGDGGSVEGGGCAWA